MSMKACFSNPELCIALAEAVAQQLNAKPIPAWESLGILPQWDAHPGGDSPLLDRFADALEKMLDAAEGTFRGSSLVLTFPRGCALVCLGHACTSSPYSARPLPPKG